MTHRQVARHDRIATRLRAAALLTVFALATVVLTSCGGASHQTSTQGADDEAAHPVDLMATFADANVATFADESSSTPLVDVDRPVLAFTRAQVDNMERGGGAVAGADLDASIPVGDGQPPVSFLVAAWVSLASDPLAVSAHTLMGDQQWEAAPSLVFPGAVLALFAADVAGSARRNLDDTAGTGPMPTDPLPTIQPVAFVRPAQVGNVCSAVADFVDKSLNFIFDALKLKSPNPTSGFWNFVARTFVSVWNLAVDLARKTLVGLVAALTAPIVDTIRGIIAAVSTVTIVISYLKPWSLPLTPSPPHTQFSIDGEAPVTGAVNVRADQEVGTDYWPPTLLDCARVLNVTLPELTAIGAQVDWKVTDTSSTPLISPKGGVPPPPGKLDSSKQAELEYQTGTESADQSARGDLETGSVTVDAKVERKEVTQLRALLGDMLKHLTDQIPLFSSVVNKILQSLLSALIDEARDTLESLLTAKGSAEVQVDHHGPPEPEPTTCGSGDAIFSPGQWSGTGHLHLTLPSGYVDGDVTLSFTADEKHQVAGTWDASGAHNGNGYGTPLSGSLNGVDPAIHVQDQYGSFDYLFHAIAGCGTNNVSGDLIQQGDTGETDAVTWQVSKAS